MKLHAVVLAGIVSGWMGWACAGVPAPDATAAKDGRLAAEPAAALASGLDAAAEAGLGGMSFEDSTRTEITPLFLPESHDQARIDVREPVGVPSVSPVPEPNVVTLMLAGLAVLAVLLSRRRRRGD